MAITSPAIVGSDFQIFGPGNLRPHRVRFDPCDPAFVSRNAAGLLTMRVIAPPETLEAHVVVRTHEDVLDYTMELVGAAGAVSLWSVTFEPTAHRIELSLALRLVGDVAVYLSPTGVANAIERIDRFVIEVSAIPVHEVPEWSRGAVLYQIFPDRFRRSSEAPPLRNATPWSEAPTSRSFLGGDLDGIAERAAYLTALGVDALYLNPIFRSPSNHRYDTVDYFSVDPALGGDAALRRLVETAHAEDIRVILDVSLNHCHPKFFAFADVVANGADSVYAEWFDIKQWPVRVRLRPHLIDHGGYWGHHLDRVRAESGLAIEAVGGDGPALEPTYGAWYGVPLMPRIDLGHPEARRYMLDVATHWIREFDIDGWRMDVVRYVDHDFWSVLRSEVRAVKPDVYLLAEVMGDAGRWLRGDEFDGVMNYTFRDLLVDYFATSSIGTEAFLEGLLEMTAMYSPTATTASQNLLGSHDTPRFLTLADGDTRSLLLATLVQMTLPGAPGLYYGDELAMEGAGDPDNRRGMTWGELENAHHRAVKALSAVRRASVALRVGEWRMGQRVGDAFVYERRLSNERAIVAINSGVELALLPMACRGTPAWTVGAVSSSDGELSLGPRSGAVWSPVLRDEGDGP